MIVYPLIRATRIASACAIVNSEYQLTVATLTEIISFSLPLLNIKIPFSSYITPLMCDPIQIIYSYNREKYEKVEILSLLSLLLVYYYNE